MISRRGELVAVVSAGFLVALAWFVMNRNIARGHGIVPDDLVLTVLAGLYFGYPIWAFTLGARLRTAARARSG